MDTVTRKENREDKAEQEDEAETPKARIDHINKQRRQTQKEEHV